MNIYVETNFILELAFLQNEHESCDRILTLCEDRRAVLVLPAFCLAESYETLIRRAKSRKETANDLERELRQLGRSRPYKDDIDALQSVVGLLVRSAEEEDRRLISALERISRIAEIVPFEAGIVLSVGACRDKFKLTSQDSIVYLSVLQHLAAAGGADACFINRNRKDFDDPYIEESLASHGCKMLFSFVKGCQYLEHFSSE
jgi:predicted nucleic acid-binding protein